MMAPGGFDSTLEKWSTSWPWRHFLPLQSFASEFTCIAYDRRECGRSGGRVERLTWSLFTDQSKGLLDHLGIDQAFLMGSCLGCSPVINFAARYPERALGLVLAQPSGGYRRKIAGHVQFNEHIKFARNNGLEAVVRLAKEKGNFVASPAAGPWASVIKQVPGFADAFLKQDLDRYLAIVSVSVDSLFDRDTIPGADPEELMALKVPAVILPGHTDNHATSCARFLEECIPGSQYWNVHLESQAPDRIRDHIHDFLLANNKK
jgi:pimeloyl-ACP methyl ester carboxylesterase